MNYVVVWKRSIFVLEIKIRVYIDSPGVMLSNPPMIHNESLRFAILHLLLRIRKREIDSWNIRMKATRFDKRCLPCNIDTLPIRQHIRSLSIEHQSPEIRHSCLISKSAAYQHLINIVIFLLFCVFGIITISLQQRYSWILSSGEEYRRNYNNSSFNNADCRSMTTSSSWWLQQY